MLDAGADVNAGSEAYGGRSATLGLVSTSWHPQEAGVQLPQMELLIERGAIIDGPDGGSAVTDSLHNGRGEAAELFAKHGARLDLEGAAGVGRLDAVRSFFNDDSSLRPPATPKQMKDGFAWACEFGRTAVVDFLLQRGIEVGEKQTFWLRVRATGTAAHGSQPIPDNANVTLLAALQKAICDDIARFVTSLGWRVLVVIPSPIIGGDGNAEFLLGATCD